MATPPPPPCKVIRIKLAGAARAEEDAGKQEERLPMDHPLSTSTTTKRHPEGEESSGAASEPEPEPERVTPTGTTRPASRAASCVKEEALASSSHAGGRHGGSSATPRAIKKCKNGEGRQEKDAKNAQESAGMRSPPVPSTRATIPAAPASCTKKEAPVRAHPAVRDDDATSPRVIKNCKNGEGRQEKDAESAQESARTRSPPVPSTRATTPAPPPPPSRTKKETPVRADAAVRDDDATPPRAIKKCKSDERRQEKDGESAGQCARTSSPRVQPSPTPSPAPAARPDPNAAENSLRAAIERARPHMRRDVARQREAERREIANMVRTVEFNDPYISPEDVLKP
uniref:Uncharacterized protein n=1 Tax=Oryza punctata TaxID=4537 RepID=A0A0E0LMM5_ORYPU